MTSYEQTYLISKQGYSFGWYFYSLYDMFGYGLCVRYPNGMTIPKPVECPFAAMSILNWYDQNNS